MPRTDKFRSLAEVQVAKARSRAERELVQERLRSRVALIGEPDFRNALISNALGNMIRSWKPTRTILRLLGGTSGMASAALGLAMSAKATTPMGRVFILLANSLLPSLMEGLAREPDGRTDRLMHELGVSWQRIKDHVKERRKARTTHTEE